MNDVILERWEGVRAQGEGFAVFSPSGEGMRTWEDVESEAREWEERLDRPPGAVLLQTGNHPSFPALLLACLRADCTAVLADPGIEGSGRERVEEMLGVVARATSCGGDVVLARKNQSAAAGLANFFPVSGFCLVKLTSGTSSLPRPVGFTSAQLLADCDQVCETMGICSGDLNYGLISLTHSYGFSNLVTPLLCRGVPFVVANDPMPLAVAAGLEATQATVFPSVPSVYRGLLSLCSLPGSLRLCISAGSPLPQGLAEAFHTKFGRKIHVFYGASECGGICYDGSDEVRLTPGFVGHPLRGVTVAGPEEALKIRVVSRAVGEVFPSGASPGSPTGEFEPSDLLVREGNGFRIVGRESDVINVAGRKVNPEEIEEVLLGFQGVEDAVVFGRPAPSRGENVCAAVSGVEHGQIPALRSHCAKILAPWKVPREIFPAMEIPRNERGKINRRTVAQQILAAGDHPPQTEAPPN